MIEEVEFPKVLITGCVVSSHHDQADVAIDIRSWLNRHQGVALVLLSRECSIYVLVPLTSMIVETENCLGLASPLFRHTFLLSGLVVPYVS